MQPMSELEADHVLLNIYTHLASMDIHITNCTHNHWSTNLTMSLEDAEKLLTVLGTLSKIANK